MPAFLFALALCSFPPPTKDELRQIALANLSQIDHLKMAWVEEQAYVSGSLDSRIIAEMRSDVLCNSDFSLHILARSHRRENDAEMGPKHTTLSDGSGTYYSWLEAMQAGTVANKPFAGRHDVSPMQAGKLFGQLPGAEPSNDCILTLIDKGVISGTESVNEVPCVILEIRANNKVSKRYWLALGKGCVPLRAERYDNNGEVVSRTDLMVDEFTGASGEHVWIPASYVSVIKIDEAVIKKTVEIDRESVVINPTVQPATFRIEYPPGTEIADTTSVGITQFYKVDQNGNLVPKE